MTDAPNYAAEDRDRRLDHALDLLATSQATRRNGAMPLIAVTILLLSGVLFTTQLSGRKVEAPAAPIVTVSAPVVTPQAPAADFELSGNAVNAADTELAPAGSERSR